MTERFLAHLNPLTPLSPWRVSLDRVLLTRKPTLAGAGALLILCIAVTLGVGLLAVNLSEEYYAAAPYHYDSAAYRVEALKTYAQFTSQGIGPTLISLGQSKDSLDLIFRLLLAPASLQQPYGHLLVLLPFMGFFMFLTGWYVFNRTSSLLLGMTIVVAPLVFPLMYAPYTGIADYWKDNLATWLLGSLMVTWLLSHHLKRRSWAALAGFLLGLIIMQRAVVGVYAGLLLGPLFLWAMYKRIKQDGLKQACFRAGFFIGPAVTFAGLIAGLQGQQLYRYYFIAGYSYGTPLQVVEYLRSVLAFKLGFSPVVVGGLALLCLLLARPWQKGGAAVLTAAWPVVGLPAVIIATSSFYHSFPTLWMVLLVVLLATLYPAALRPVPQRFLALALAGVVLAAAVTFYNSASIQAGKLAKNNESIKLLYEELIVIIKEQPEPHRYIFLFHSIGDPFINSYCKIGIQGSLVQFFDRRLVG